MVRDGDVLLIMALCFARVEEDYGGNYARARFLFLITLQFFLLSASFLGHGIEASFVVE